MLKPWQVPLNKAPREEGTEEQREREPKAKPKEQNPKWVTRGQRNKVCSRAPKHQEKTFWFRTSYILVLHSDQLKKRELDIELNAKF
jgi:hypothetical protein